MSDGWKHGLDELSRVPMSAGLRERSESGSRLPDPGRPRAVRVGIVLLAFGVFVAGAAGLWEVLRPAASSQVRPAADQADPQRVYGATGCVFRSGPEHKIDLAAGMVSSSDPVAACQELWGTASDTPPPDMIACVDPASPGHILVVEVSSSPDGACAGIDASPLPEGWDANLGRWHAVESAIAPYFPSQGGMDCQRDGKTALDAWRNALDENGFTSWAVTVDDANVDRPCFNYDVDYDAMKVSIVHDTLS